MMLWEAQRLSLKRAGLQLLLPSQADNPKTLNPKPCRGSEQSFKT